MRIRRRIWGTVWLLSLAAISFYGGTVSYCFFFGVTLIPFISCIYLICVYLKFKIYQELGSRTVVCGQPMSYYFVLKNDDWFAFSGVSVNLFSDFSYVEELPDHAAHELLPGESYKYKTRLVCKYRGEYEVGIKEIVISDLFGLFRLRYTVPERKKTIVLPRVVKISELNSIADISAVIQREALMRATEYDVTVRDYVAGDEVRLIHWKATAREQKLKVRTKIGEEKQGVSLVFDTQRCAIDNRVYLPVENKILEIVLALGFFMAEKNIPVSVYCGQNGTQNMQIEEIQGFDRFYKQIAEVVFDKDETCSGLLEELSGQGVLAESFVVFFVLREINDDVMALTRQLMTRNIIIVIYVVTDQNIEYYSRQNSLWRRIIAVSPHDELEEVL